MSEVLEKPNEIADELLPAVSPTSTAIAEFSADRARVEAVKARLGNLVWDCATTKGDDAARADRKELVGLRTGMEKKRLELNRDDQAKIDARNKHAKELTAELKPIEEAVDAAITAQEEIKKAEKAERARVAAEAAAAIQVRIDGIRAFAVIPANVKAVGIQVAIENLRAVEVSLDAFGDRAGEAAQAKAQTLERMDDLLDAAQEAAHQVRVLSLRHHD